MKSHSVLFIAMLSLGSISSSIAMMRAPVGVQTPAQDNKKNKVKTEASKALPPAYQNNQIIPLTMTAVKQSR
ncbi:MAG: hypothetical protein ACYCSS_05810 [Sulfuriferula sp.]